MNALVVMIFAAILACARAAPVNPKCPTDGGTYAYCNQTPNSSLKMIGINYLYTESDNITDLLVDLCSHYNDIVSLYFRFLVCNDILLAKVYGIRITVCQS